jgi:hypothetical protein
MLDIAFAFLLGVGSCPRLEFLLGDWGRVSSKVGFDVHSAFAVVMCLVAWTVLGNGKQ